MSKHKKNTLNTKKNAELSLKELNQQTLEWEKQEEAEFRKSQGLPEIPTQAAVSKPGNTKEVIFLRKVK